ncbi:hypothetical protein EDC04DRAFT_2902828 [Pisolithus marmoratus]|nr:hypothetical protein EDC04DRAFT_2902828 [Pisolithus marmoratus]
MSLIAMSSPNKQTKCEGDDGVDSVVISDLIAFLSGLSLNQMTADATILEIQAWARPSLFGTPPSSPVTFPTSPVYSYDSTSPLIQVVYPASLCTPAPLPSPVHSKRFGRSGEVDMKYKQAETSTCRLLPVRVTSDTVPTNPTSLAASTPKSASSAFTTAFGNDKIMSSGFSRFEVVCEMLWSLPVIGNPELRTFTLETPQGEKHWQQLYKGIYFDVPGPGIGGSLYLVTKGTRIGILAEWQRASHFVTHVKGSCYVTVPSVEEGVHCMMNAIKLGKFALL